MRGRRSRPQSLRRVVLWSISLIVLYFVAFALYLAIRVAPQAQVLRGEAVPLMVLFDALSERTLALNEVTATADRAVVDRSAAALDTLRAFVATIGSSSTPLLSDVPRDLRAPLAQAERLSSDIEAGLAELVALIELNQRGDALRRLRSLDSLHGEVTQVVFEAERGGFAELAHLEAQLSREVQRAVAVMLAWGALGFALLLVAVAIVRRRVERPLTDLQRGLDAVAQGDLNSRVEVRHRDEIGELAAHFNEMTGVLRCRAEEQGRFAAAGQLIAGVAHEVNNPLMAIAALTDSRLEDPDLPAGLRDDLQQMRRQARRAGKLLSGLLRFVRAGEPLGTSLALNDVVRSAVDLVSYRLGVDEITLELRLDPSLPLALGSAGRIEQVVVNLLSNGLDALRDTDRPRRLTVDTWTGGGKVFAAVTDSGEGIVPMMERRLFLPFATTKGADGTGLGLYISRQILRESGGELRHEPTARGARFVMELIAAPSDAVASGNGSTPGMRSGRPEPTLRGVQVLVVDDEPAVRQPIARFLGRRGALVREAGDGREALDLIEALEPAVLLVDLRMPRMDGMELCERMARERPHLLDRVIILSGDLSQLGDTLPVPADRVLAKPVELREIEKRLVAAVNNA